MLTNFLYLKYSLSTPHFTSKPHQGTVKRAQKQKEEKQSVDVHRVELDGIPLIIIQPKRELRVCNYYFKMRDIIFVSDNMRRVVKGKL